ncbi:hypothetical protein MBLNU230_g7538t1 [Neophaeotheca triangularis]
MASLLAYFNKLLPFATPGTPLIQDLTHLAAICTLLYFAPQIQERLQRPSGVFQTNQHQEETAGAGRDNNEPNPNQPAQNNAQDFPDGAEAGFNHREPAPAANHQHEDQNLPREEDDDDDSDDDDDPQPGPANRNPANAEIPPQRNVGAKKLKSIQRRDQRRAYHEFQRSQGEAQRARDAEGAEERDAALAAEKARRKAKEAEVRAREAREREVKKEGERREWEEGVKRREEVVRIVRGELAGRGRVELWEVARRVGGDVDDEWVEKVLRVAGVVGGKGVVDGGVVMVTGRGWVVRVTGEDMRVVYEKAAREKVGDQDGRVSLQQIGTMLTRRMDEVAE